MRTSCRRLAGSILGASLVTLALLGPVGQVAARSAPVGSTATESTATRRASVGSVEAGTVVTGSIRWQGRTRTYRVIVPASYTPGTATPLVVGLHGGFGSGEQFQRDNGLESALSARGMLGVFPDGVPGPVTGVRTWNAGNCCAYSQSADVDDVGFIGALVTKVQRAYDVDPQRIYAIGHSNGAMMSYRLACELPGVFAAIAPVEGAIDNTRACQPRHRMNVLIIHGLRDRNVPYRGGVGEGYSQVDYASVAEAVARWRRINRCEGPPIVTVEGDLRTKDAQACDPDGAVRLQSLADGNHEWPGGADRAFIAGSPSDALDATPTALDFFLTHPQTG